MRVKKHAVWDKEGKRHDLEGSVETKGLLGTDGRKYVLDLYRITPLDVAWAEEVEASNESGVKYPHRMSVLRLELVEAYWRMKMQDYVKAEVEKKRADKPAGANVPSKDQSKITTNGHAEAKEEVAAQDHTAATNGEDKPAVDALASDQDRVDISNFNLTLNPDACTGQAPQTEEEKAEYAEDEKGSSCGL